MTAIRTAGERIARLETAGVGVTLMRFGAIDRDWITQAVTGSYKKTDFHFVIEAAAGRELRCISGSSLPAWTPDRFTAHEATR